MPGPDVTLPRVASLSCYPVKSVLGEQRPFLDLDPRGCVGDRLWSVRTATGKIGSGKPSRRFAAVPGLLALRAQERDGRVVLTLPDGSRVAVDAADVAERLTRHLGQPVTLARESEVSHFDDGPVSLIGTASVAAVAAEHRGHVDAGRFRANLVIATGRAFEEEQWIGRHLGVGTAVLAVELASPRCVMVDAASADLPAEPGVLAAVGRVNRARLGVVATVVTPGRVRVGDEVRVLPRDGAQPCRPGDTRRR